MTTGERLDALIEDSDTTIKNLAEYLQCNVKQITRWKNDEAEMGIRKLQLICKYFGVSADYVLELPKGLRWPK